MRNKVILIIFLLFIIALFVAMFVGIELGNFQILSISQLNNKNKQLEEKINEASNLTSVTYPETVDTLEETYEKYTIQKQKYEEISGFTDKEKKEAYETKQYDISYLWELFGKYAKSYNLTISMDVKKGTGENLYDLHFSVSGQYVNISQFITEIENNSDLYFRIYDFRMSGSSTVTSSFIVKGINIDPDTLVSTTTTTTDTTQTEDYNIEEQ